MKTRSQVLEIASVREFDLIVVGGGISGAGIAQDAASRGMSVLLIERDDFASGASGRTSKLIHGGPTYLQKMNVKLARNSSQEQATLAQLAPHLIRDFSFVLPLRKQQKIYGWKAKLGLTIFDLFSKANGSDLRHQDLSQKELVEAAPGLTNPELVGGIRFHDCVTDDSRLVMEVLKTACDEGANVINYMEVKGISLYNGTVSAVQCHDRYSGETFSFKTRAAVIAAGVWTDELLKLADPTLKSTTANVKSTYVMLPMSAFETNNALFLPSPDGGYVSMVPWHRALMVGSTETPYSGDLRQPLPTMNEVEHLLKCVNAYSAARPLTKNDVIAAWSGVKPVINASTGGPKEKELTAAETANKANTSTAISTKDTSLDEGATSAPQTVITSGGLIATFGGKLSNYLQTAEDVVDQLIKQSVERNISLPSSPSRSKRIMVGGWKDKNDFLTVTAGIAAKARKFSIEPATLDHLIASYGKDAQVVVDLVERQPLLSDRICPDFPPIMAEVAYCVLGEMAVSLEDLLFRRLRLALLHQMQCKEAAPKVASLMQSLLNWDDARAALELQTLENTLDAHMDSFRAVALSSGKGR